MSTSLSEVELARLSAEVAQKVDGAKVWRMKSNGECILHAQDLARMNPDGFSPIEQPAEEEIFSGYRHSQYEYTTDLPEALTLLDRIRKTCHWNIASYDYPPPAGYCVSISNTNSGRGYFFSDASLPVAICRAVLAAIEVGIWKPVNGTTQEGEDAPCRTD